MCGAWGCRFSPSRKKRFPISNYPWGGYLIFRFGGASQVFIDGRADMYSQQRRQDYDRIVNATTGWQDLLRSYDVNIILTTSSGVLSKLLRDEEDRCLVYFDPQALLFLRRDRFQEFFKKSPPREVDENGSISSLSPYCDCPAGWFFDHSKSLCPLFSMNFSQGDSCPLHIQKA